MSSRPGKRPGDALTTSQRPPSLQTARGLVEDAQLIPAIEEYRRLASAHPDDPLIVQEMADVCIKSGDRQRGAQCLARAADIFQAAGQTHKALAVYRRILQLSPDDPVFCCAIGDLYAHAGRYVDAQRHYLDAATSLRNSGSVDAALSVLQRSANVDAVARRASGGARVPDFGHAKERFDAYVAAADDFLKRGSIAQALQALHMAVLAQPSARHIRRQMLDVLTTWKDEHQKVRVLRALLDAAPDDTELMVLLGRAFLGSDMLSEAQRIFERLVHLDETHCDDLLVVARRFVAHGELDSAYAVVERCCEPLMSLREPWKALEALNAILDINPGHSDAWHLRHYVQSRMAELSAPPPPLRPIPVVEGMSVEITLDDIPILSRTPKPEGEGGVNAILVEQMRRHAGDGRFDKAAAVAQAMALLHETEDRHDEAARMQAEARRMQDLAAGDLPGAVGVEIAHDSASATPVDALTGIASRSLFDHFLDREWRRGQRSKTRLSVVLVEVDGLDTTRATEGPAAADDKLKLVARELFGQVKRGADLVARDEGARFLVLLPDTPRAGAKTVAEAMHGRLSSLPGGSVSVSVGGVTVEPSAERAPDSIVDDALDALIKGRRRGRGVVELGGVE